MYYNVQCTIHYTNTGTNQIDTLVYSYYTDISNNLEEVTCVLKNYRAPGSLSMLLVVLINTLQLWINTCFSVPELYIYTHHPQLKSFLIGLDFHINWQGPVVRTVTINPPRSQVPGLLATMLKLQFTLALRWVKDWRNLVQAKRSQPLHFEVGTREMHTIRFQLMLPVPNHSIAFGLVRYGPEYNF